MFTSSQLDLRYMIKDTSKPVDKQMPLIIAITGVRLRGSDWLCRPAGSPVRQVITIKQALISSAIKPASAA